ncbi:MAG TPA: hypothetical protein VF483_10615 [Gemmatimonadaceae bacterium]
MTAPAVLVQLFEPWAKIYADSKLVTTVVVFGHIASLMFAGGLAIALDRATMRAVRSPDVRSRHLADLAGAHRVVVSGLALSAVTGLLLFASDVETYFVSWIFWTKMTLIVLLLGNGYRMTRVEGALRLAPVDAEPAWRALRVSAMTSLVLWFVIALAGVALVNAS